MHGPSLRISPQFRLVSRWAGFLLGIFFLVVVSGSNSSAEPLVQTLGGGRLTADGPDAGFTDGDILQASQFHNPFGCTVDGSGRIYVADRDNGALRRLDLAANRCKTILNGLRQPIAVAIADASVIYVLTHADSSLWKLDRGLTTLVTAQLDQPTAMAYAGSGQMWITQAGGTVVRVTLKTGAVSAPVISGLNQPAGIAILDTSLVAVSETGSNYIRLWDPNGGGVQQQIGSGAPGFADGLPEQAQFNAPYQIAKAPGGSIAVADRRNHRVRLIDPTGFVTTIYGVDPLTWEGPTCVTCSPAILPGWLDGTTEFAEAREPVGVAISSDGRLFATEDYYHLVREVTGADLTGGGGEISTNLVVLPPVISPVSGYFPMGTVISVSNPNTSSLLPSAVYYTVDGTEPGTNSFRVEMNGGTGAIFWQEKQHDLSSLRVRAFLGANPSDVVSGEAASVSALGVPQDIAAGIGSTVIVPVVVNLRTNVQLQSLQFRVEITPQTPGAPMIPETFRALPISTNDFIPVFTGESKGEARFSSLGYQTGQARGLAVTYLGTNANLMMKAFGVPAMLSVPIPPAAHFGDRYTIQILNASGTADAAQQIVPLTAMAPASIAVTDSRYLVGDSSTATWYNASQLDASGAVHRGFGDGILDNSDVNNAFAAALGLRLPYPQSDLFDALDAYPEDTITSAGGDGLIRFLDWQVILVRSLGLDLAHWERSWAEGGVRITTGSSNRVSASTAGQTWVAPGPGAVWMRQAMLSASTLDRVVPGTPVDVPIYVDVRPGYQLGGLAFRATIEPEGAAPGLERAVQFISNPNLSAPSQLLVPSPGTMLCGWPVVPSSSFDPPLQGRVLLGQIRVTLPDQAREGQVYTLRFANADGAPDLQTQYNFETRPASLWVLGSAQRADQVSSDEWRAYFFGSLTAAAAADAADPDHDGAPNSLEYLAGTNPIDAASNLQLQVSASERGMVLRWLSAPGKTYRIESALNLLSNQWDVLAAALPGSGRLEEWVHSRPSTSTCFYRIRIDL